MFNRRFYGMVMAAALLLAPVLLVACGGGDEGLSREQVQEIVRSEVESSSDQADAGLTRAEVDDAVQEAIDSRWEEAGPDTGEETPGLTLDQVEAAIRAALADLPTPEPGIDATEARLIAQNVVATIPGKSSPAEYTKFVVRNAISRYAADGLNDTLTHYNRTDNIDGQWYVFIFDSEGVLIGHYDANILGEDLNGALGTDSNGYNFGPDMLSATEEGKWVSYVYRNPESGAVGVDFRELELKNAWVVKHDGLLFGSGWYIEADEFTKMLVSVAVERFREGGLAATVAYFASPGSALAGLEAAIDYYNDAETVDGRWFAFIGDPDGQIVAHSDPSMIGSDTQDLFGEATFDATLDGSWVTTESLRVWVAGYDSFVFGSGWHRDESGG